MSIKPLPTLAFALLLMAGEHAAAQTNCGNLHPNPGVFICYPNPAENPADADLPEMFHISAQANPAEGQTIRRYSILLDGRTVYEGKLPAALKKLSIETNLKSPVQTSAHTLKLVVYGAGSAEVTGLRIHESPNSMLCDPFSRTDPRACNLSKPATPLRWQAATGYGGEYGPDAYMATLQAYSRNLKRLEADASDAIAVDSHGNLYTASHVLSDVEVRKYSPDGGILYDALVRSCGDGFVQVSAIAATDSGQLWIAANTTACFKASGGASEAPSGRPNGMRGIVILVDTTKASSIAPPYFAWLAESEYRATAIRADSQGNAYVAGIAGSSDFPHNAILDADARSAGSDKAEFGFVSALSKSGSVLWSTLVRHLAPATLSIRSDGNVLLAGGGESATSDSIVAEVAERGRRLSWVARSGGSDAQQFRPISTAAISTTSKDQWVLLTGTAVGPEVVNPETSKRSNPREQRVFFATLRTCGSNQFDFHLLPQAVSGEAPEIALGAALDSVAAEWFDRSPSPGKSSTERSGGNTQSAAACRPPA